MDGKGKSWHKTRNEIYFVSFFCKGAIVEITGSVFIVLKNKMFVKATVIWQFVGMEHVLWIQVDKGNVSVPKVV